MPTTPSLTGWEKRIQAYLDETSQYLSRKQVKTLAARIHARIHARAASMQSIDPDHVVLTFMRHGRSVPVDSTVGEHVARTLTKQRNAHVH